MPTSNRNNALDLLKAASIIAVVLWHAFPAPNVRLPVAADASLAWAIIRYFVGYHVSLVAVPTFLAVSLYLFAERIQSRGPAYVRSRLWRLGTVFAFWVGVQWVLASAASGSVPAPTLELIMRGGPPVLDSGSVLYFLFVLVALSLLQAIYSSLGERVRWVAGAMTFIASLAYFEYVGLSGGEIPFWSLANFAIMIPLVDFVRSPLAARKVKMVVLAGGALVMSTHDTVLQLSHYQGLNAYHANHYGRISIALAASALVLWALDAEVPERPMFSLLSRYSLGIYAIHFNVLAGLKVLLPMAINPTWLDPATTQAVVLRVLVTGVATGLLIWTMKRARLAFAVQ